jgi:hypothetical protein
LKETVGKCKGKGGKVSWRTHTKEVCEGDGSCQPTTKFKSKHASQQKERSKGQLQLSKSLQAMAARCEDSDSSRHKEGPSGTMQGTSVRMHVTSGLSNLLSALMLLAICIIATFTCVLPNLPLNHHLSQAIRALDEYGKSFESQWMWHFSVSLIRSKVYQLLMHLARGGKG